MLAVVTALLVAGAVGAPAKACRDAGSFGDGNSLGSCSRWKVCKRVAMVLVQWTLPWTTGTW
jgi:hypothetical protein